MRIGHVVDRAGAAKLVSSGLPKDSIVHILLRRVLEDAVTVRVTVKRCQETWNQNVGIIRAIDAILEDCDIDGRDLGGPVG